MTAPFPRTDRYLEVVECRLWHFESRYQQSIAVLDIQTAKVTDSLSREPPWGCPNPLFRAGLR